MPVQSWWHQRSPSTGSKSSDDYDSQDPSTSGLSHKDLDLSPRTEHFRGGDGISPNTCTTSSFRANASTPKEISSITSEAYALKRASSRAKRGSAGPESNGLVLLLEVERLQDALEKKSKEVRLLHRCISEKDQLLREEAEARMRAECVQDQLDFARKQLTARDMNREVNTKWLAKLRAAEGRASASEQECEILKETLELYRSRISKQYRRIDHLKTRMGAGTAALEEALAEAHWEARKYDDVRKAFEAALAQAQSATALAEERARRAERAFAEERERFARTQADMDAEMNALRKAEASWKQEARDAVAALEAHETSTALGGSRLAHLSALSLGLVADASATQELLRGHRPLATFARLPVGHRDASGVAFRGVSPSVCRQYVESTAHLHAVQQPTPASPSAPPSASGGTRRLGSEADAEAEAEAALGAAGEETLWA